MTMNVRVINKQRDPRVENYARERLDQVVGCFENRLATIDVHVRDDNADKGGLDKTCGIDAKLIPRGMLHVQATERDVFEAILKAVHRLETVVSKTVDRGLRSAAQRHEGGGLRRSSQQVAERSDGPDER